MGAWGEIKIMLANGKVGISVGVCTVVGHGGRMRFHYSAERSGKEGGGEKGGRKENKNGCGYESELLVTKAGKLICQL